MPKFARAHVRLGAVEARAGLWQEAAAAFGRAAELAPDDISSWFHHAALLLRNGDVEGYRRASAEMLRRFGKSANPEVASFTARACALSADAGADPLYILNLAEHALNGTEKHPGYRSFLLAHALALYRGGDVGGAARQVRSFAPKPAEKGGQGDDALAFAVLAMAHHRLGKAEQARAALTEAQAVLAKRMPDPGRGRPFDEDWGEWLQGQFLVREAERLLRNDSDADAKDKPARS
jgi:Flp pilus assembly protein TadD